MIPLSIPSRLSVDCWSLEVADFLLFLSLVSIFCLFLFFIIISLMSSVAIYDAAMPLSSLPDWFRHAAMPDQYVIIMITDAAAFARLGLLATPDCRWIALSSRRICWA